MARAPALRRADWLVPALLVVLGLVPAAAGVARLVELAAGAPVTPANLRFFAAPLPVVLHLLAVIAYAMLGAFQFAPVLRRRRPGWHRAAGKVLVMLGLVSALTGLWMTLFYPWPEGDGQMLYSIRLLVGVFMVASIVLAMVAIPRRDFASHGAWMTRAYAIGMGAGTQVLTHIPYFLFVGRPDEPARAWLMAAGWVINMVIAEWVIIRRAPDRKHWLATTARSEG